MNIDLELFCSQLGKCLHGEFLALLQEFTSVCIWGDSNLMFPYNVEKTRQNLDLKKKKREAAESSGRYVVIFA